SAPERAVLILRGVFDYEYDEIARLLNRSEASCRQLYSRGKKHIDAHTVRHKHSPKHHAALVGEFLQAMSSGNLQGLKTLLADDVALYSDGGGKVPAATRPLFGQARVSAFLIGLYRRGQQTNQVYDVSLHTINEETGIVLWDEAHEIITAAILEIAGHQIQAVRFIRNPDKLTVLARHIS
ncbi:MAG: sigma factor-like helix-turn-helix DNA-binding protein, partial [Aggregatilineales bacterium]